MPRLLSLLAAEQVIISKDDETVSLISVVQHLAAVVPSEIVGQQNVLVPIKWAIFAFWMAQEDEENNPFEQRVELLAPDGTVLLAQNSEFVIAKATHAQVGRLMGLPVPNLSTGPHEYTIRLSIRKSGDADFNHAADYPLSFVVSVPSDETVSP